MTISIDWPTKVINVPRSFMTLVQSTPVEVRELDLEDFRLALKDLEDNEEGIPWETTHSSNAPVAVGGIILARVLEIINDYTVTFENDSYIVNLIGANTNLADRVNPNLVSIRSSNSAGLVQTREIEASAFQGHVTVNAATGTAGTAYPIGTPRRPVSNIDDAKLIADVRSIDILKIQGNLTIVEDVSNFDIVGDGTGSTSITIGSGAVVENVSFSKCELTGDLMGAEIDARDCSITNLYNINGEVLFSLLASTISISGMCKFISCYSGETLERPTISVGSSGNNFLCREFSGRLQIANKTGPEESCIDMNSGHITLEPTVTNGTVTVRGVGNLIDRSTGTTVVNDFSLVSGEKFENLKYQIESLRSNAAAFGHSYFWDPINGDDSFSGKTMQEAKATFAHIHDNLIEDFNNDVIYCIPGDDGGETITSTPIIVTKSGLNIRGSGRTFHISVDSISGAALTLNGCREVAISGIAIKQANSAKPGILLQNAENCLIENTLVYDCGGNGIEVTGPVTPVSIITKLELNHVEVLNCAGKGVWIHDDVKFVILKNQCHIEANLENIRIENNVENVQLLNCIILKSGGYGINIVDSTVINTLIENPIYVTNTLENLNDQGTDTVELITNNSTIAQAVWDESMGNHIVPGSAGAVLSQIQFNGRISIDTIAGSAGIAYPVGSISIPSNNMSDAITIEAVYGFDRYSISGGIISVSNLEKNTIEGKHSFTEDSMDLNGFSYTNCLFRGLTLTGDMSGSNNCRFEDCYINGCTNISGEMVGGRLTGNVSIDPGKLFSGVELVIEGDTSSIDLQNTPGTSASFDINSGYISFTNSTSGCLIELNMRGGETELDSSITGGDFYAEGYGVLYGDPVALGMNVVGFSLISHETITDDVVTGTNPIKVNTNLIPATL